jgi:hypothetical protein
VSVKRELWMNGFKQISAFYSWVFENQDKYIQPEHISLYMFFINNNNRANWIEWFECSYGLGMQGSCIRRKDSYYKYLKDLHDWGLLEYRKGANARKLPLIRLINLYENKKILSKLPCFEDFQIPQIDTSTKKSKLPQNATSGVESIEESGVAQIKPKTYNLKLNNKISKKKTVVTAEAFKAGVIDIPETLLQASKFIDCYSKWLIHLEEKGKLPTFSTVNQQLEDCAKWGVERSIENIKYSISRGWQGIFEDNNSKTQGSVQSLDDVWLKEIPGGLL